MTQVQKDRLTGFNASLKLRGVSVTVNPDDADVQCQALIEVVNEDTQKRLQIADRTITHVVHILRTALVSEDDPPAAIVLGGVSEIDRNDATATYRVKNFRDDEHKPQVEFFCVLSPDDTP